MTARMCAAGCGTPATGRHERAGAALCASCFRDRTAADLAAATIAHGYATAADCLCGRNFATVRGLREHLTKARARAAASG